MTNLIESAAAELAEVRRAHERIFGSNEFGTDVTIIYGQGTEEALQRELAWNGLIEATAAARRKLEPLLGPLIGEPNSVVVTGTVTGIGYQHDETSPVAGKPLFRLDRFQPVTLERLEDDGVTFALPQERLAQYWPEAVGASIEDVHLAISLRGLVSVSIEQVG